MDCTGRIVVEPSHRPRWPRSRRRALIFNRYQFFTLAPSNNSAEEMKAMKKTRNDVGYGRPPIEHQFKPGRSGNPSGRPKDARRFTSDLLDELGEIVADHQRRPKARCDEATRDRRACWSARLSRATRTRSRPSSARAPAHLASRRSMTRPKRPRTARSSERSPRLPRKIPTACRPINQSRTKHE